MIPAKIIILFLDGVGIGRKDKKYNPFFADYYPALQSIFGGYIPHIRSPWSKSKYSSAVPVNATLGVAGLPQSGTGQASLLAGINAPRIVGKHFGPYLHSALKNPVKEKNIFKLLKDCGRIPRYANAFPRQFFDHIARGGKMSAITYAWLSTGAGLPGYNDIINNTGLSADMTNERWRSFGYTDIPVITARSAGKRLVQLSEKYDFIFYEYFFTDHAGHTRSMEEGIRIIRQLAEFIGGILDTVRINEILFLIISDHGNLEDMSTKGHTRNPVPLVAVGKGHSEITKRVHRLPDLTPLIVDNMK